MKMWRLALFLVAASSGARAECDACVAGHCYRRRPLLTGLPLINQLAIDRTNNILYAPIAPDTITALFLDQPKTRTINVNSNTKGIAVNQQNHVVYTSHDGTIFGHKYEDATYHTDVAYRLARATTPAKLRYEDTLYIINTDGSVAYYSNSKGEFTGYSNLNGYNVTDMANVANLTHWYFVADNSLYRFIWTSGEESTQVIANKKYVLSISKYGDVHFGDAAEKKIYRLDRDTRQLKVYAFYWDGAVEDFVFDRDDNIVFRDTDGNLAQWQWVPGIVVANNGNNSTNRILCSLN